VFLILLMIILNFSFDFSKCSSSFCLILFLGSEIVGLGIFLRLLILWPCELPVAVESFLALNTSPELLKFSMLLFSSFKVVLLTELSKPKQIRTIIVY
jgi:hypothetical protein